MVSEDAATWLPVIHLPGLDMDWVAEISPGIFYGPIHRQALENLRNDGAIPPTALLFTRNSKSDEALAACIEQAEQTQKLLMAQVSQMTAQLAERDARLQRFEQQAADVNMLQALTQEIISAQEIGKQQIADAVASAQAAIASQTEAVQEMVKQQAKNQRLTLNAIAETQAKVSQDIAHQLAEGRQTVLDAVAAAQSRATDNTSQLIRETATALTRDVKAEQAQVTSKMSDIANQLAHDMKEGRGQITATVSGTVASLAQQLQQLSDGIQTLEKTLVAELKASAKPVAPQVEQIYVEAEAMEVIPPQREHHAKASAKPPKPEAKGFSMAELEQQAQRELERLGAQGINIFKRTT